MGISLKRAFLSVSQDSHWISKILIGGLLLFFPSFVYIFPGVRRLMFDPVNYYLIALFSMLVLVVNIVIIGYLFKTVHNRIIHLKSKLPSWNYFTYYLYIGVKACIGGFIFLLPFFLLNTLIVYLAPKSLSLELFLYAILEIMLQFICLILFIMLSLNFSMKFKVTDFWDIKKAYNLVKGNICRYFILIFSCLFVAFLNSVVTILLVNAQIFSLLIPFVSFYVCLVYADLLAQFALNCDRCRSLNNKSFS